ncbi:hypothetical protein [Nonomuraea insulae]|uniref:Uncharacterized protein n=1 Tax=Nonomuraea insulae TaxID=1616787 RepID=A0ABW1D4G2_9ACTN
MNASAQAAAGGQERAVAGIGEDADGAVADLDRPGRPPGGRCPQGNIRLGPELAKAKPGRPAPRDVLSAVFDAGNLKLNPFFESPVVTEPGKTAPAVSVGSGKSGHIELYKGYFGEEPAALHTYMNPPKPLSDPDGRMLILLHELAHLMGTLPGNEDFKDIREKLVYPFNAQIVRDCVKNH